MPQGEVPFADVSELLDEFLCGKRMGVKEISLCPLGSAYVRLEAPLDLDKLVRDSPHAFDDVSVVFQHHAEGLNWRRYHMNR